MKRRREKKATFTPAPLFDFWLLSNLVDKNGVWEKERKGLISSFCKVSICQTTENTISSSWLCYFGLKLHLYSDEIL